ncbi:hypothetical protein [Pleomorphovibrio marinus]|uniref:hypothetical protein n=1 Tax=Pleomorphovibrio marinus TaxID=2164132 RepID=UPI000E0C57DF|nr:hypothetical protein [Pleomorphovibrio marinus]
MKHTWINTGAKIADRIELTCKEVIQGGDVKYIVSEWDKDSEKMKRINKVANNYNLRPELLVKILKGR